jgi:hypothetical protein
MKALKASYLAVSLYVICTMLLYFTMLTPKTFAEKPYLFFQDFSLDYRIHTAIIEDHNGDRAIIARLFYNKATFLIGNVFVSFTRATDPVYIFGLIQRPYYDNYYPSPLPFWEFPLFVIAAVILIKDWEKRQKQLKILLGLLCISLIFASLFLSNFGLKYIPLVLTIQLITGSGLYSFFVWLKKLCLKK